MEFIDEKIQELAAITKKYQNEVSELDASTMDIKPSPTDWSMNECIDHLIQSNKSYDSTLPAIIAKNYHGNFWTKLPFLPGFFGSMILKAVKPISDKKIKTFKVWEPRQSRFGKNLLEEYLTSNADISEKWKKLQGMDLDKTIINSPASPVITYSLRSLITITVDHQKRHLNQLRRIKSAVNTKVAFA